jgi:post-segregation antitoxin (ccd killing protein)
MVFVTSGYTSDELLLITDQARRETRVVVVNLVVDGQQVSLPRTKVLNVTGLREFAAAWDVLA